MKKILIFLLLIALLAVASCSQNASRSEKSNAAYADSILVLVNGEEWRDFPQELLTDGYCMENDTIKGIFEYFADRNLRITSAVFWKGEKGEHVKEYYRPEYGERVNNGILDIGVEALVKSPGTKIDGPDRIVGRIRRRSPQEEIVKGKWSIYHDDTLGIPKIIGGLRPFSLAFINGERRYDFPEEDYGIDFFKALTRDELEEILKKKNYVLDDVNILQDYYSLVMQQHYSSVDKYRQGGFVYPGTEQGIKAVYEIKAHLINPKGEIFRFVKKMPRFPGGYDAQTLFIAENVRHPKEMLRQGIYGMVLVDCVIGKDGAVEEPKVIDYHLKDKAGNPCNNPTIKKLCNKEALRVVKKMPRWEPGRREDGEAVRVREHITIYFLEKMPPQTEREK